MAHNNHSPPLRNGIQRVLGRFSSIFNSCKNDDENQAPQNAPKYYTALFVSYSSPTTTKPATTTSTIQTTPPLPHPKDAQTQKPPSPQKKNKAKENSPAKTTPPPPLPVPSAVPMPLGYKADDETLGDEIHARVMF
ncbi:hypothetical protein Tco_0481093 [Tanacetum coccineum]